MTLATFKQLPRANLYSEKGFIFEGISLWGYVSYQIGDAYSWAVFDYQGKLYRGDINLQLHSYSITTMLRRIKGDIDSFDRDIKDGEASIIKCEENIIHLKNNSEYGVHQIDSLKTKILNIRQDIDIWSNQASIEREKMKVYLQIKKSSEVIFELPQLFIAI